MSKKSAADGLSGQFEVMNQSTASSAPSTNSSSASSSSSKSSTPLSAADKQLIQTSIKVLLTLLDKLESESSTALVPATPIEFTPTSLGEYSEVLSHALTKFVLFTSQGEAGVMASAGEEVSKHITGVSSVLRAMLDNSGPGIKVGPTRRSQILALHSQILASLRAVFLQLQQHLLAKSTTRLDASLTGKAWDVIEKHLKQIPLTNATAVGRCINQQCSVMKDARAELDEIKVLEEGAANGASNKSHNKDEDEDEDEDDFDDLDDEDMLNDEEVTAEEFKIVPSVKQMCDVAQALVKNLYIYILKIKLDEQQTVVVDWFESILKQVTEISGCMDDLIDTVYSPQEKEKVLKSVDKLAEVLRQSTFSLIRSNVEAKAEWPIKSAAAADSSSSAAATSLATASFSSSAEYQKLLDDAIALKTPIDEEHTGRVEWLKKVLTQIYDASSQAHACK